MIIGKLLKKKTRINLFEILRLILNKYIDKPEEHYHHFKTIKEDEVKSFVDASLDKTIKVNFDFLSINSFNLKNKEYTSKEHFIKIIEKSLEEINNFQSELDFNEYLFNKDFEAPVAYFTGNNPNQKIIVKALDFWIEKALNENNFFNAINQKLSKEVISISAG